MDDNLYLRYKAIALYKATAKAIAPLAELLCAETQAQKVELCADVFAALADSGVKSTGEWITRLAMRDENAFSRAAARGERIDSDFKAQVQSEFSTLKALSLLKPDDFTNDITKTIVPHFCCGGFGLTEKKAEELYAERGCGILSAGNIFSYRDDGLVAASGEPVRLSDLKNYAEEKAEVVRNTENFIAGLPAFNALLYGDRGTGKSTTVRALGYEYPSLKIIELPKARIAELSKLFAAIRGYKQKFIIFIDDLSFNGSDERVDVLKATLEGSLDTCGNALLYCTSNRRHLIKEIDKSDAMHRNDEVQSELALFDRFGLVVTYINPDKAEFIDILKQILRSRGIKWRDEYAAVAELSALKSGGRSPRAASRIADVIEYTYAENAKNRRQ